MSTVEVREPGLLTTVQDLGREGYGPMGVSPSGAADSISLRAGNRLVGNPEDAACLELTLLGGAYRFPQGAVAALTGSDFGASIGDAPVACWTSFEVGAGQTLRIGPTRSGARCYLCVRGGIVVKPFLGSSSTHVLSGLGGFEGRALRRGDVLEIGPAKESFAGHGIGAPEFLTRRVLRVTAGPQSDRFSAASRALFYASVYRVTEEANRMGLRLEGPPVAPPSEGQLITEGVPLGAIQVPAAGQPIILFVEQQTTGGYPKIANVIAADLATVGQLRPRDEVRFELVSAERARRLLVEQEEWIASLD